MFLTLYTPDKECLSSLSLHSFLMLQFASSLSRLTLLPKATAVLGGKEEVKVIAVLSQNVHDYIFPYNCFWEARGKAVRRIGRGQLRHIKSCHNPTHHDHVELSAMDGAFYKQSQPFCRSIPQAICACCLPLPHFILAAMTTVDNIIMSFARSDLGSVAERIAQWEDRVKQFRAACAQVAWDGRLPKLLCHQLGNGCSLCNGEVFPLNDSHVVPFVSERVLWMVPPSLLYICLPVSSTLSYMFSLFSLTALYSFGVFCHSKGLGAK